jgi:hypothetical protein
VDLITVRRFERANHNPKSIWIASASNCATGHDFPGAPRLLVALLVPIHHEYVNTFGNLLTLLHI